jgi:hypothetical protein
VCCVEHNAAVTLGAAHPFNLYQQPPQPVKRVWEKAWSFTTERCRLGPIAFWKAAHFTVIILHCSCDRLLVDDHRTVLLDLGANVVGLVLHAPITRQLLVDIALSQLSGRTSAFPFPGRCANPGQLREPRARPADDSRWHGRHNRVDCDATVTAFLRSHSECCCVSTLP